MDNIFEKASRIKLRFETTQGQLSTEDLWDLSLVSLDRIAKAVNKKLKEESEESFIKTRSVTNTALELRLELLKFVIAAKIAEKEEKEAKLEKNEKLQFLRNLLAEKKTEEMKGMTPEEIEKQIAELSA